MSTSTSVGIQTAIGIDIGGTKISSARVNEPQGLHQFQQRPTPAHGKDFITTIVDMINSLRLQDTPQETISAVGIATAGIVDPYKGEILGSTGNLPALRDIPSLKSTLEKETGFSFYIENDANAAAYGEYRIGGGKGHQNVLMVTLGTGVGTGIIIDGKLLHGAHFSAGESGHIAISMNHERLCTCGKWDCWETYASGTGLAETARRLLEVTPNAEHTPFMANHKDICDVTTHDVISAWKAGDPLAKEMLDVWHLHIATGIGSLINVLDPEVVVIGGGMAQFVNFEELTRLTQLRAMMPGIRLVPAELGNQAGIVGAAYLALEHVGAKS